jgi:two-component system chemotaxis sensor kinase CheA
MSYETIAQLTGRLTSELVLSDPEDLNSIKKLLPMLKLIHGKCQENSLTAEAKTVLKARKLIDAMAGNDAQADQKMYSDLERVISELSGMINEMNQETAEVETIDRQEDEPGEIEKLNDLEAKLHELSMLVAGFCPEEIPDLGAMLNSLTDLIDISAKINPDTFHDIALVCREYVINMTLENINNTKPVEEGILLLRSILGTLKKGEPFIFDYSDVLELLKENLTHEPRNKGIEEKKQKPEIKKTAGQPEKISGDDLEIIIDFVSEAEENLDTIEVSLIELEDDPTNTDIINDIFRPFHTIKGVSGFLSLTKINTLAHTTENLLDSARSGEFVINQMATDAILASVDTLKALIGRLKEGTETGYKQPDDDIDVDDLRENLKQLQISLSEGRKEPLGEILVRKKELNPDDLEQALEIQKQSPDKKIGEILVEGQKVEAKQVASALMDQAQVKKKVDTQVKVSTQKLDDLVDYAGELVIAQSMLRQKTSDDPSLNQTVSQLGQIVNNMQNIAMSMRMIPIKATFMKMIRLVRDLSRKSGKQINLSMNGEDTEIDRNVVDALYEPMVHMIRNACDHGIEASSDRAAAGKSAQGSIYLRAYHKGGNIVIEIEDNGKGLDRDRIIEKAKSTGLITGEEHLTDTQAFDLIMQPGFSTAKEVTDVSGRGVGMDVVKDGIEKFRGHLNIESEKGSGTKFIISLPLTLAIIDGMLVQVDNEKYVIPTISIQKAFKPGRDEYFTVEGRGEMVKDRGSLIPLIRLNEIYGTSQEHKSIKECLVVVVESKEEKRALLIDELLGKDEYVIKNLGESMDDIEGIAGGAILADGKVGLILDVHGIFTIVSQK